MTDRMTLAVIFKGQIFPIDDESDLREYNLEKPMAKSAIMWLIQAAMNDAIREVDK